MYYRSHEFMGDLGSIIVYLWKYDKMFQTKIL